MTDSQTFEQPARAETVDAEPAVAEPADAEPARAGRSAKWGVHPIRTTPRHRQQSTDTKRGASITGFEQTEAGLLFTLRASALPLSNRSAVDAQRTVADSARDQIRTDRCQSHGTWAILTNRTTATLAGVAQASRARGGGEGRLPAPQPSRGVPHSS